VYNLGHLVPKLVVLSHAFKKKWIIEPETVVNRWWNKWKCHEGCLWIGLLICHLTFCFLWKHKLYLHVKTLSWAALHYWTLVFYCEMCFVSSARGARVHRVHDAVCCLHARQRGVVVIRYILLIRVHMRPHGDLGPEIRCPEIKLTSADQRHRLT